jgi:hypothetical protein
VASLEASIRMVLQDDQFLPSLKPIMLTMNGKSDSRVSVTCYHYGMMFLPSAVPE